MGVSQIEVIKRETAECIKSTRLKMGGEYHVWQLANPDIGFDFGYDLIHRINMTIALDNATTPKNESKTSLINRLPAYAIAEILLATGDFQLLRTAENNDGDRIIYRLYDEHGKFSGISKIVNTTAKNNTNIIATVTRNIGIDTSKSTINDVMAHIEAALSGAGDGKNITYGNTDYMLVPCNNGIYDMREKRFTPHDSPDRWTLYPDTVFLNKLDTDFVVGAQKPVFRNADGTTWDPDSFIESLFDKGTEIGDASIAIIYEIIQFALRGYSGAMGHMVWLINSAERAAGKNGKSTLMALISGIIDHRSVPEWAAQHKNEKPNYAVNGIRVPQVSISEWHKDYILAEMAQTCMCLISDENDENGNNSTIKGGGIIKNIARHQPILFNPKFRPPYIKALMGIAMHAQNQLPKFSSKDDAIFSRNIFLMFNKDFSAEAGGNVDVKAKYIVDKQVQEYILYKTLADMPALDDFTPELLAALQPNMDETKRENLPVFEFLDEVLPMFYLRRIPLMWLFELYNNSWKQRYGITYQMTFKQFKSDVGAYITNYKDDYALVDKKFYFDKDDKADIARSGHPAIEEYANVDGRVVLSYAQENEYKPGHGVVKTSWIDSKYADKQISCGAIEKLKYVPLKDKKAVHPAKM